MYSDYFLTKKVDPNDARNDMQKAACGIQSDPKK